MKRLLVYLKDYKKAIHSGCLCLTAGAFFELMVPLVMASIIDRGIADQDMGYVGRMGLILIGLARDRSGKLHHGAVFCSQGGGGLCYKGKTGSV